jgi:hypothetical protein
VKSLLQTISSYWNRVQTVLYPYLLFCDIKLTPELKQLTAILDLLRIEEMFPGRSFRMVGAPPCDRASLARAFIAKHALKIADTKALRSRLLTDDSLRRICGWHNATDVPSESTFSRAFSYFADINLTDELHQQRVTELVGDTIVWHQAIDSTDIVAREKANPNPEPQYGRTASGKRRKHPKGKRGKPGRPKNGEVVEPELTRMERQLTQIPEIALLMLPTACDMGCKPDNNGHEHYWKGYKLHLIISELGIPLCAATTSASVHDSQVAIPLMQLSARRVTALYDLMDRGYDAKAIRECSSALGHVPVIARIARAGQDVPEVEPDRARQYAGRTVAERFNSRLKDEAGGKNVRVRGHRKVHAHLMFGVLIIFADVLLRLAGA